MNKTLYFVRHCQATGQEPESPLTEVGKAHAVALMGLLQNAKIERIISSPFVRAYQSIQPLSEHLGFSIEFDDRLVERVLSPTPLEDWHQRLAETFDNVDLCFEGGESSRQAMDRGVAVIDDALQGSKNTVAFVTHGNLMTLMLKHFDHSIGYLDWKNMFIPDVYRVSLSDGSKQIERLPQLSSLTV